MSFSPQAGDVNNVGKLKVTIAQVRMQYTLVLPHPLENLTSIIIIIIIRYYWV